MALTLTAKTLLPLPPYNSQVRIFTPLLSLFLTTVPHRHCHLFYGPPLALPSEHGTHSRLVFTRTSVNGRPLAHNCFWYS